MTTSYIISKDGKRVICSIDTDLKSGTTVDYGYHKSKNALNANIDYNLVNAREGKISRAKKWHKSWIDSGQHYGVELFERNFYVSE